MAPFPETDDQTLEQRLFPPAAVVVDKPREPPDFVTIHRELRRKAVTLMLLWQEYKAADPEGYQYSQFCHLYHQWKEQIDPVMRLEHRAGETLFVDWAGIRSSIVNTKSIKLPAVVPCKQKDVVDYDALFFANTAIAGAIGVDGHDARRQVLPHSEPKRPDLPARYQGRRVLNLVHDARRRMFLQKLPRRVSAASALAATSRLT